MTRQYKFALQFGRNVTSEGLGPEYPSLVSLRRFDEMGVPFEAAKDGCIRALMRELQNHCEGTPERKLIECAIRRVRQLDEPTELQDLEGFVV